MEVIVTKQFLKDTKHLDNQTKLRLRKAVLGLLNQSLFGKPLHGNLSGERSVRIKPYRLIYSIVDNKLYLLKFDHRKTVYD